MVGKILIVDSVATNRILFKVALGEAFYQPLLVNDGDGCLVLAKENAPDLIMLDLELPDLSALTVIEKLRANPATRDIPILGMSADQDADLRKQALLAGADDVLRKSGPKQILLARVRNLIRGGKSYDGLAAQSPGFDLMGFAEMPLQYFGPALISFLSTRSVDAHARCFNMAQQMSDRIILQSREEALVDPSTNLGLPVPDIFVIDATASGIADCLRLMSELRSRTATRHSAVCVILANDDPDAATMAYDQGADDLVNRTIAFDEFALRLRTMVRRKRREDQLRASVQDGLRMAIIDPLTGLHNRRFAMAQLATIADRAGAMNDVFAVMVIDLDRFKSVNDRFGHSSGDAVLVEVARRLRANLRTGDLLARIGGEEFLVALSNTSFDDARTAADRLCQAIEETQINVGLAAPLKVTVSIGLAVCGLSEQSEDVATVIDRADRALLRAKSEGRNKVTISQYAA